MASLQNKNMILLVAVVAAISLAAVPSPVSARRKPPQGPGNFTFYVHNHVYDPAVNNSVFNSAYSAGPLNFSQPNPYNFGVRSTFEMPITAGSSPDSTNIGVAQGLWVMDSLKGFVLLHMFTAAIRSGTYRGSIAVMGQIDEAVDTRILAVVGGTGDFLAARGVAYNKLVLLNHVAPSNWTLSFHLDLYY